MQTLLSFETSNLALQKLATLFFYPVFGKRGCGEFGVKPVATGIDAHSNFSHGVKVITYFSLLGDDNCVFVKANIQSLKISRVMPKSW